MNFSSQSPALHCTICSRDFSAAGWAQHSPAEGAFPHPEGFFRALFLHMETCIMFLCNADPIPFLPFFHHSSFLSLLLHLFGSQGSFFALSRKDILGIQFENFFTSQYNWLILLKRLLFSICSHTLEIFGFGYVTAKFSTLGWFWSAYGFALLTFLFKFSFSFSFSGTFVTTWAFFSVCCFQNTFIFLFVRVDLFFWFQNAILQYLL